MRFPWLLLLLGLALVRPGGARAPEFIPLDSFELALQADVILEGTIVALHGSDGPVGPDGPDVLEVAVHDVIVGPPELEREPHERHVRIVAFRDWMCAQRHVPYATGQHSIFFLEYRRDEAGRLLGEPLSVMGAGNEGERSVDEDEVPGKPGGGEAVRARRVRFGGLVVSPAELASAVTSLRECFTWQRGPAGPVRYPEERLHQTCSDFQLWSRMDASALFEAVIRNSNVYLFGERLKSIRAHWEQERDRGATPIRRSR